MVAALLSCLCRNLSASERQAGGRRVSDVHAIIFLQIDSALTSGKPRASARRCRRMLYSGQCTMTYWLCSHNHLHKGLGPMLSPSLTSVDQLDRVIDVRVCTTKEGGYDSK